jgi:heme/copper-type cytochrome/quinol oxidase subunit 3
MHGSISIWFFIGVLLMIYGAMILGEGIFELTTGNYPAGVQLTNLHAPVWWGAVLLAGGIFYAVKFPPRREGK